ncbi:MAG TPA: hypothetical protein DD405_07350 [Desulfobacteraceae bacterium]|nr:hypothetical protein [Desulfobacteraceae bacterium]
MRTKFFFIRLDGESDSATIMTRKKDNYYESTVKIGDISKRVNSGMLSKDDSLNAALRAFNYYKENILI